MAALADEVIVELQGMVECPVCLEPYEEPRMLPCQHSFCTTCLESILGTDRKIRCPCCNKYTRVPNGVQELPVDFRANTQLEMLSKYGKAKVVRQAEAEVEAAEAASQDAFEILSLDERCPVCEQTPTESKNLSCGHHLCENCVQFLLPVGGDTLHCPTCSRQTRIVTTSNTYPASSSLWSQPESQLIFRPQCGKNAVIHPNRITAHRKDPMDCMADAAVRTSRHLKPNELFEVRLDKKIDKWGCSMKVGVATYCPTGADVSTGTNKLGSGPWWMSGCKVHNVLTTIKQYEQDLYKLKVGDCVGVQRRGNGDLHFYINGVDLGVAAHNVPADVYGVVNVCGNAEQVTITDTSAKPTWRQAATPTPTSQDALSLSPDLMSVSATSPQQQQGRLSLMARLKKKLTFKKKL